MIRAGVPALILAPMEGVTDAPMRALMSARGGFTHCVSEFLRVTKNVPPAHVFRAHIPEMADGWRTPTGMLVQVQLLGGDAERLAETAALAVKLGAPGVDLNFGCPAQTVNRHDGGATLLKYPERIEQIVRAVRNAVPAGIPVSAKLRLGWDSIEAVHENSERAASGGADWIVIHARTRMQGYQPPVFWTAIGEARARVGIPVVANGDIWTLEDFLRCRDLTGAEHFMLGRGALADPHLAWRVARELGLPAPEVTEPFGMEPEDWAPLIQEFVTIGAGLGRVKQWLRQAHSRRPRPWFETLKRFDELEQALVFFGAPTAQQDKGKP